MRGNQTKTNLNFCNEAWFLLDFLRTRFTIMYTVHKVRSELHHIVKVFFCQLSDILLTLRNTLIKKYFPLLTLKLIKILIFNLKAK